MTVESIVLPHQPAGNESIVVPCSACQKDVTAPAASIGHLVGCPFCQQEFIVPAEAVAASSSATETPLPIDELASLESQLKENMTQITELRGHVSRLNMELHRHQIRMKKLADRHLELQSAIATSRGEKTAA